MSDKQSTNYCSLCEAAQHEIEKLNYTIKLQKELMSSQSKEMEECINDLLKYPHSTKVHERAIELLEKKG